MATGMSTRFPSTPPFSSPLPARIQPGPRMIRGGGEGERIRKERGGGVEGGREEGLAFNYLGFPRQEAIHLRVYAIFEGRGEGEIADGCNGARRQVCPKYYDNIYPEYEYESLIQRHRLRAG